MKIWYKLDFKKNRIDCYINLLYVLICFILFQSLLAYHVIPTDVTWRLMQDTMEHLKRSYDCIEDFSIQSSTLEQLFLQFARAAEKSAKRNKND